MSTKTISITEDAYNILKAKKDSNESFSEIIVKLSGKRELSSFYGVITEESAEILKKNIHKFREEHLKLHKKRLK